MERRERSASVCGWIVPNRATGTVAPDARYRAEGVSVEGAAGLPVRVGEGVRLERDRAVSGPLRGRPGERLAAQVRLSEGAESAVGLSEDERPEQSLWSEERMEERLWRERDCARQGWDVDLQPNRVVAEGRGGGAKGRCCLWQLMARAATNRPEASTVGLPGAVRSVYCTPWRLAACSSRACSAKLSAKAKTSSGVGLLSVSEKATGHTSQ